MEMNFEEHVQERAVLVGLNADCFTKDLLSLYLVLAVFWLVRSIIDTIDDRKREKRNAALDAEREARNAKWEAERQQLERERAIREVEYHEARMKDLESK